MVKKTFLNKISTCVLTSCEITYGGEERTFFRPTDGGVHQFKQILTLNFKELEIITRERTCVRILMAYFEMFPKLFYDNKGDGKETLQTNL